MNLIVTTNWDNAFIEGLDNLPVEWICGRFPKDLIGSEMDPDDSPPINKVRLKEHIAYIHRRKLKFNYLIDSHCLDNREYDREWVDQMLKFIQELVDCGVDGVTVFIPYLVEIIRKNFPRLKLGYGTLSFIRNVNTAKYFNKSFKVDWINLHPETNRDFKLLKAIHKSVNCELRLIANMGCLSRCPFMHDHCSYLSHKSAQGSISTELYQGYFHLLCNQIFLKNPEEIIKADFIRPEDLMIYEKLGFNNFIIQNNTNTTKDLLFLITAYVERKYDGDLIALLSVMGKKIGRISMGNRDNKGYPMVENKQLNDFLLFFQKQKVECYKQSCHDCGYCKKIAKKAVRFHDKSAKNKLIKKLKESIAKVEMVY